jgi:hypothetical protein
MQKYFLHEKWHSNCYHNHFHTECSARTIRRLKNWWKKIDDNGDDLHERFVHTNFDLIQVSTTFSEMGFGCHSIPSLVLFFFCIQKIQNTVPVLFLTDFALNPQLQTLQPTATISGIGTKLLLMNFRVLGATPFSVLCSSSSAFRKCRTHCWCFSPQILLWILSHKLCSQQQQSQKLE